VSTLRDFSSAPGSNFDLVVAGHLHQLIDDDQTGPRLVVLGSWIDQANYLKIDQADAMVIVEDNLSST
jgi:hypothetical protein